MEYDLISIGCISYDIILELPFIPKINSECFIKKIKKYHGGAAANVAAYSAFYGELNVGLVSSIGDDDIGNELLNRMKEYGICIKGVSKIEKSLSTQIFTLQYPDGNRSYIVQLGALEELTPASVPKDYLTNSKLFYLAPASSKIHNEFIEIAASNKIKVAFNPGSVYIQQESKHELFDLLKQVDFLFVNEEEAISYSNINDIKEAGLKLLDYGVDHVIITRNDSGCSVFFQNQQFYYPGYNQKQLETIGAGDAFAAGFLSNYLKTGDINSSAKYGNVFGAYRVSNIEARKKNPSKRQFFDFLKQYQLKLI